MHELKTMFYKHAWIKNLLGPAIAVRRYFKRREWARKENIYQNVSLLLEQDPIVRLESFQGVFSVGRRSDVFKRLVINGDYEPDVLEKCLKYIGCDKDAIDVGANVGFYSVLMAKINGNRRVLAVEPTAGALAHLYRNLDMNGVKKNVIVFEGVVSAKSGKTVLNVIKGKEEYSSLGVMIHPAIIHESSVSLKVEMATIDELVARYDLKPGFIKIDVEGCENLVLSGAKEVLSRHRPVIISEISDSLLRANGSSSSEVVELVKRYEYTVIDPIFPSLEPGVRDVGDILCLPSELL